MKVKIAIIGAGISGLVLANLLKGSNSEISIFEKARGAGGRMSTRRHEDYSFDHGAQCFTIRDEKFRDFLEPFFEQAIVAEWLGNVVSIENGKVIEPRAWNEKHFVASPTMNFLCKKLAENLNVSFETEILPITKIDNGWHLKTKQGQNLGVFDVVISTAPPKQTVNLFASNFSKISDVEQVEMHPCFALMLGFKDKIEQPWMAAKIRNSKIKWVSFNNSKPARNSNNTSVVVHASNSWSHNNVDADIKYIESELLNEFAYQTGVNCQSADYISVHRWLYSIVKTVNKTECLFDESSKLGVCGDLCLTSRIEEAFISAHKMSEKLKKII